MPAARFSENGRTRKEAAKKLLERLSRGPHIPRMDGCGLKQMWNREEIEAMYVNWFREWIEDDLVRLIPELRKQ